ncbi:MAG: hypothetical protein JRJ64_04030 [Deltaproteobacteria bacterium]|nr:hypothetical protein [Deltaproteobacteria bacterium]
MSGESADKPEAVQSHASRRRRALRVPIADIPRASMLDDSVESEGNGNGAAHSVSNVVELDPPSGVTAAVEPDEDRDPTEPSFMTEPDPFGGDEPEVDPADLSEPSIDVHFSDPPAIPPSSNPPELRQPSSRPPTTPRYSEPPEELFLEDADVLSR